MQSLVGFQNLECACYLAALSCNQMAGTHDWIKIPGTILVSKVF